MTAGPSISGLEYVSEAMRLSMTLEPGWSAAEQTLENGWMLAGLAKNEEGHAFVMYVPGFGIEDFRADMDGVIGALLSVNPDLDFELSGEEDVQISDYDAAYYIYNVFDGDAPWGFINLYVIDAQAYGMPRACYLLGSRILVSDSVDASIITDTVDMFFTLKLLDAKAQLAQTPAPAPGSSYELKAYANPEMGVRLHYPAIFESVVENPDGQSAVYFLLNNDDGREMFSVGKIYEMSLKDFLDSDASSTSTIYESIEIAEEDEVFETPSGQYYARIFNALLNGEDYTVVRIAGQVGGDVFVFTMRCEAANFERMAEYADSAMQSLAYTIENGLVATTLPE